MSDTSSPTSAPTTPTTPPLPNDEAARSPTGEILDARPPEPPKPPSPTGDGTSSTTPSEKTPPDGTTKPPTEPSKAPETYADFTVPEGFKIDADLLAKATPIFKELGLTQAQAQQLISLQADREVALGKAPADAYATLRKDWVAATTADKDMAAHTVDGKTGLDAVKIDIGRALSALGDTKLTDEFRAAMDLTGAGDHPAFVKALWKLSQLVGEGSHVPGGKPSPEGQVDPTKSAKPSAAKSLYPNLA